MSRRHTCGALLMSARLSWTALSVGPGRCWCLNVTQSPCQMHVKKQGVPGKEPEVRLVALVNTVACRGVSNSMQGCRTVTQNLSLHLVCAVCLCRGPGSQLQRPCMSRTTEIPRGCERGKCPPPPKFRRAGENLSSYRSRRRRVNPQAHVSVAVWCRA